MQRTIAIMLILISLMTSFGCQRKTVYRDEDVFSLFAEAIANGEYSSAYGYVSSSVKGETSAEKGVISETDFADKYKVVFDALEVAGITYDEKRLLISGSNMTAEYSLTYETGLAGTLTYDFKMMATLEDGAWRIKWTPRMIFPDMDWGYTMVVANLGARRGDILADGGIVAETVELTSVFVNLNEFEDEAKEMVRLNLGLSASDFKEEEHTVEIQQVYDGFAEATRQSVCSILEIDTVDYDKAVEKAYNGIAVVAEYKPDEIDIETKRSLTEVFGVGISDSYSTARDYPNDGLLAHTLGYVGYADVDKLDELNEGRSDLDGLYTENSIVGKAGLESLYEPVLRGKDGLAVTIRDASGSVVSTIYRREAENGKDVKLTIDYDLQVRAEVALDLVLYGNDTAGAVVAMDPTTGAVKALASYPTYDLNLFAEGISNEDYQTILNQSNAPLYNRTTQGLYPPGSAFKVFTATAAMETGTLNSSYVFTGNIRYDYWTPTGYGTWIWPDIKRATVYNRSTPLNMENGLLHSDNIYFANAALLMGKEKFLTYLQGIGMCMNMPFELSVATSQLMNEGTDMNYKLLADTGYGQGEVLMTPLQLATMYCAFRNGGDIPVPYITDSYYVTEGTEYKAVETFGETIWIEDAIAEYSINVLTPMLENIVSLDYNGTGRALRARGCTCAGKTGTAEIGSDKSREISWFVGFRTNVATEDELLVLVVLEVPTDDEYSELKFDIARELISMDEK